MIFKAQILVVNCKGDICIVNIVNITVFNFDTGGSKAVPIGVQK